MKKQWVAGGLCLLLMGCLKPNPIPVRQECFLEMDFSARIDTFRFTRIEAEGSRKPVPLTRPYRLPVNGGADFTRYYFQSQNRKDTLIIIYKREFRFDPHEKKGYQLILDHERVLVNTLSAYGTIQRGEIVKDNVYGWIILQ